MRPDRRTAILQAAAGVIARRGVRGLRMPDVAAEAGVSTALVYYHFTDRAGMLRHTMEFISDRAERYTADRTGPAPTARTGTEPRDRDPYQELEHSLLLELQDRPDVRENSTAWGELRATAVFDPALREALSEARGIWLGELTETLARIHPPAPATTRTESAERLTAALEGLSTRWLSEVLPLTHARDLLRQAIAVEVAHLRRTHPTQHTPHLPTDSPHPHPPLFD